MDERDESFLTRWSRLKQESRQEPAPTVPTPSEAAPPSAASAAAQTKAEPEPELPPLEAVNLDTGVAAFFREGVDDALRREAAKRLFTDPHFNVMDGLDVYIEDFSQPDPIPASMLKQLVQFQNLFKTDSEDQAKTDEAVERTVCLPSPAQGRASPEEVSPRVSEQAPAIGATDAEMKQPEGPDVG